MDHWQRRLERLLRRPKDEEPLLTIYFDGLNHEPSVRWIPLLKTLQADPFAGCVQRDRSSPTLECGRDTLGERFCHRTQLDLNNS